MATDTFVNILDLQPITEVVNGDYLIVETPAGTRIINFKDFILPNANILISQTVSDNTTAILSNFNLINDYIGSLSGSITQNNTSNSTTLCGVSSNLYTEISEVNSSLQTTITGVSGYLQNEITDLQSKTTNIAGLSTSVYVGKTSITIASGASVGMGSLSPITTKFLEIGNIMLTPANAYAAKNPAYISTFASNSIITITAQFSGTGLANQDAIYNALAITDSNTNIII